MKTLKEYLLESSSYTIKDITVDEFIARLKNYPTIADHAEDEIDHGSVVYVNGRNTRDNEFTNMDKRDGYQWVALMNGGKEVAIQLLQFLGNGEIELVIAERSRKASGERDTFKHIIDAVIDKYKPKSLSTFPLHDKLKEKYMSYGFVPEAGELVLHCR